MKIEATMQELSKKLEPKLCKNCRFYEVSLMDRFLGMERFGICKHPSSIQNPQAERFLLVDGKTPKHEYFLCVTQRQFNCGIEGKHWEAKK